MYVAVIFELKVDTYLQECRGGDGMHLSLIHKPACLCEVSTCVLKTLISWR
jgi:hypothetical protein